MNTLEYRDGVLYLLDQTRLPGETVVLECRDHEAVAAAIRRLSVRGAPAIGVAAAYGVVVACARLVDVGCSHVQVAGTLEDVIDLLWATRPTAINLAWALERMRSVLRMSPDRSVEDVCHALLAAARAIEQEDREANRVMGDFGSALIPQGANVLTHCNAGALATGAFGTALGAIMEAHRQGKGIHVWVDETRPLLQGARLTTWELKQEGVPHTLITDNMAAHFMAQGRIDLCMVGADRIVANGDAANKIGTYGAAVLARAHNIPFYFVAPTSTVDLAIADGRDIPIEERDPAEVTSFRGVRIAPEGTHVANPAFDVTPARLIAAIVTERGVVYPPFTDGLKDLAGAVYRSPSNTFATTALGDPV